MVLQRLKELKTNGEVDNIWHVHLVNCRNKYLGSIGLEELIIFNYELNFEDIPYSKHKNYSVNHKDDIKSVVELVTHNNLNSIAVVNDKNRLIGRITSDDIYDIIQESATE